jgi:hypothetical protein
MIASQTTPDLDDKSVADTPQAIDAAGTHTTKSYFTIEVKREGEPVWKGAFKKGARVKLDTDGDELSFSEISGKFGGSGGGRL